MNELRRKTDEEIAKLLTPEQLEKYRGLPDRGRRGRQRDRGREGEREREREENRPAEAPVF